MKNCKYLFLFIAMLPAVAPAVDFVPKGAGADYFQAMREAFDISVLAQMLYNFYAAMRSEKAVFDYLMAVGDGLLAPVLAPLIIVCAGSRLLQDMHDANADIFTGLYATAAVVLILALYRLVMAELVLVTNALAASITPNGLGFEDTMRRVAATVDLFNQSKKNKDPIALLVDKSLSLYTEYFMAWGTKWGVMVLHGLLDYLRATLFAINYVLGIFLLPFIIIKQSRLPRNWLMITAFIFLWAIMEPLMIAVMGNLGVSALEAALSVPGVLPIFSESLFYVMIATVNILIGIAMLSSVWIVKSYLLSPAAISAAAALFSLPAISLARMSAAMGSRGALAVSDAARATIGGRGEKKSPSRSLPLPSDIFGGGKSSGKGGGKSGGKSGGRGGRKPGAPSNSPSPGADIGGNNGGSSPSVKSAYHLRTLIEHRGKLDKDALPENVTALSRVGQKQEVNKK